MTNLAAAVELRDFTESLREKVSKYDDRECMAVAISDLKYIIAELSRGAGGEAIKGQWRVMMNHDDSWSEWIDCTVDEAKYHQSAEHGRTQGRLLYTRPPVAGLAELTDDVIEIALAAAKRASDNYNDQCIKEGMAIKPIGIEYRIAMRAALEAAREFLGKVE